MFTSYDISASGMEAQRIRLNTISSNLANVNTTRGADGKPYRRRDVLFAAAQRFPSQGGEGLIPVSVRGIVEDARPFKTVYEPGHPDANKDGYVQLPNINPIEEMVNMLSAIRAYEANVAAFKSSKDMMTNALEIGK